ncbi:hypothetical protein ACFFF6_06930 [Brachybacterium hainanense]|uniref:Secreted protein n=2 Tax=Brachybacterium hainanense TaxID=1541174 RepID=A0ABV6R9M5_9MICO
MRTILVKKSALALLGVLALAACGGTSAPDEAGAGDATAADATQKAEPVEVGALTPRITLAHDGGITTIDSADGAVLGSAELEGYTRLGPAGDGRHVVTAGAGGFRIYDTGLYAQAHGDHSHYFTVDPALTGLQVEASEPGHIVPHGARTSLFADGTGEITTFDPAGLAEGTLGEVQTTASDAPHHGVAVPLEDGGMLRTEGTADSRTTVLVEDAEGNEIARTDDCPGVHGEAAAQPTESGDVVTLGCENGPVVYRDGAFHKVAVDGDYQRSGNQKGSEASPVVLADNKVEAEPAGGTEHPTSIALIDTRADTMRTVELGSTYWFRSLDRGPAGEALVLTADGELNIIDPDTGAIIHEVPVMGAWEEPEEWQTPGPMLAVADGTAFVVDPATKKLSMVDVASGEIYRELDLPVVPHEIQVTTGTASGEYDVAGEHAEGEGHDHEGHDHASDAGGAEEHDHEGHDHEGHDH